MPSAEFVANVQYVKSQRQPQFLRTQCEETCSFALETFQSLEMVVWDSAGMCGYWTYYLIL
jgi:hypothetical protein